MKKIYKILWAAWVFTTGMIIYNPGHKWLVIVHSILTGFLAVKIIW